DRGPGPAAGDRHPEAAGDGEDATHLVLVVGEGDRGGDESEERGIGGEGGSLGALDAEVPDACGTELGGECGGQRRRGPVIVDGRPIRACGMGHCRHVRIVPLRSAEYQAPLSVAPAFRARRLSWCALRAVPSYPHHPWTLSFRSLPSSERRPTVSLIPISGNSWCIDIFMVSNGTTPIRGNGPQHKCKGRNHVASSS